MSTEYQTPEVAPEALPELPVFSNGITPGPQPALPVLTEPVPRAAIDPSVAPEPTTEYRSPIEAVPGSGGIVGVQPEE